MPILSGKKTPAQEIEEPTEFKDTEYEILEKVRRARDEIKDWIEKTFSEDC